MHGSVRSALAPPVDARPADEPDRSEAAAAQRRATALRRVGILDSQPDDAFDDVVRFAARALGVPVAAIGLLDGDRRWCKAVTGTRVLPLPDDTTLCRAVVAADGPVVVEDIDGDDEGGRAGGRRIRAYAGVPIHAFGEAIGALCVVDHRPRRFGADTVPTLRFLARHVEHLLDLVGRRTSASPPDREVVVALAARLAAGEAFESVAVAIDRPAWVYDVATLGVVAVNDLAIERYGWTRDEFLRRSILDLRPPSDRRLLAAAIDNSVIDRYSASRVWRHLLADGQMVDVRITSVATTHLGRPARLVLVTDVTERVVLDDAVDRAGRLDSITGLPNRRELLALLTRQLEHAAGGESAGDGPARTAVICIDLDRFKLVNDTLGHDAGDALLGATAARIRERTPTRDVVARIDGDGFAVLRTVATEHEAHALAEEIRRAIDRPFLIDDAEHDVSASVGVAVSAPGSTASGLVAEAEAALDAAKRRGRNDVVVCDEPLRRSMAESGEVQRELHRAIDRSEIVLDVQPIIDLGTGSLSYEALARWNHPDRGRLAPGRFIPVAEESGLIRRLGAQLLELGARQAAALGATLSVNVSVRQFDRALVHRVAALIDEQGLAPGQLVIEITESAVVDGDHAAVVLAGLRAAGADIWIDDFGTGYSSLARLASLTVDALKLPRQFVADLDSPHGWGIAASIVALARALDIDVIAEGVETERQLEQVHELGCDAAQGYLLGRPRPFAVELAERDARTARAAR